jgi:hypothetical protein
MAKNWEDDLRKWKEPPTKNEEDKRDRTATQVEEALKASGEVKKFKYRVYPKGSYANNTNVHSDYDVDIAVECKSFYYHDLSGKAGDEKKAKVEAKFHGNYDGPGPTEFRAAIEAALVARFGRTAVTPGQIALRVRERKTTLPADVVPCYQYRDIYDLDFWGDFKYYEGTKLFTTKGKSVINWPQQQLERGIEKNTATGHRYKQLVRALKKLQSEILDDGKITKELPSFLIECLVYNVPNDKFGNKQYVDDMRAVLVNIFSATKSEESCSEWVEVNWKKYLFRPTQSWQFEQANALVLAAWRYMGFS